MYRSIDSSVNVSPSILRLAPADRGRALDVALLADLQDGAVLGGERVEVALVRGETDELGVGSRSVQSSCVDDLAHRAGGDHARRRTSVSAMARAVGSSSGSRRPSSLRSWTSPRSLRRNVSLMSSSASAYWFDSSGSPLVPTTSTSRALTVAPESSKDSMVSSSVRLNVCSVGGDDGVAARIELHRHATGRAIHRLDEPEAWSLRLPGDGRVPGPCRLARVSIQSRGRWRPRREEGWLFMLGRHRRQHSRERLHT